MASLPVQNETEYALTAAMQQHIILDAHEHFGEDVRSIRVQVGLERHAFNARTHEVRYAFSPTDFGLVPTLPDFPEPPRARRPPRRNEETDPEFLPAPFEESEVEAEEPEPLVRSLESLEAGDEEEDAEALFIEDADVFRLDEQTEEEDDDEDEVSEDDDDEYEEE